MDGVEIVGAVRGTIHYPEHPDHEGGWGIVGGDDVTAERRSFRSVNEAARWCRKVLRGETKPRWTAAGNLLTPHTPPRWDEAWVTVTDLFTTERVAWFSHDGDDWTRES